MNTKRYFYDNNTEEVSTYNEMKKLWERYKDDEDFCTYDTDNFDDYLEELTKDMGSFVTEIGEEEYEDFLYNLAVQEAEDELCNIHCPFNFEISCGECEAFQAVSKYMYEKVKASRENI